MASSGTRSFLRQIDFFAVLLIALLAVLWFAGGSSRQDVLGQFVSRGAAWLALIGYLLLGGTPKNGHVRGFACLFFAVLGLTAIQLLSLPPALWSALPGRELFERAAEIADEPQPWRPISLSPSGTLNALGSLIVPGVVLLLLASVPFHRKRLLPRVILVGIALSAVIGIGQFSGVRFDNPLANDTPGEVNGLFANRNHFALFLAIGCALTPYALIERGKYGRLTLLVAGSVLLLLFLTILAAGSRMGIALGVIGIMLGLASVHETIRKIFHGMSKRVARIGQAVAVIGFVGIVGTSIFLGRAESFSRFFDSGVGDSLRKDIWSTTAELTWRFFPVGSGAGTFDPVFRIAEPDGMLGPRYINLAHNDLLQLLLEYGLAGLLLLLAAIGWWGLGSWQAWRGTNTLARAGSAILLLVFLASIVDYPARTPLIMSLSVIAAYWLYRPHQRVTSD